MQPNWPMIYYVALLNSERLRETYYTVWPHPGLVVAMNRLCIIGMYIALSFDELNGVN